MEGKTMSLLEKSKVECLNKAQKNANCIKEKNNKLVYFKKICSSNTIKGMEMKATKRGRCVYCLFPTKGQILLSSGIKNYSSIRKERNPVFQNEGRTWSDSTPQESDLLTFPLPGLYFIPLQFYSDAINANHCICLR